MERAPSEDRWELFVTHHYFTGECILFRLSSTILFGRRPVSMSQSWRTIWDAEPCRPAGARAGHQAGGKMLMDGPDGLLIVVGDHDWAVDGVAVSQRPDRGQRRPVPVRWRLDVSGGPHRRTAASADVGNGHLRGLERSGPRWRRRGVGFALGLRHGDGLSGTGRGRQPRRRTGGAARATRTKADRSHIDLSYSR